MRLPAIFALHRRIPLAVLKLKVSNRCAAKLLLHRRIPLAVLKHDEAYTVTVEVRLHRRIPLAVLKLCAVLAGSAGAFCYTGEYRLRY